MPSAIAIRMYCVNLLDIFLPPKSSGGSDFGRFRDRRNTLSNVSAFATIFPLWNERPPTSVMRSKCGQSTASTAASCNKNRDIKGGSAMNDTVNRQGVLVEKPAGKLAPQPF